MPKLTETYKLLIIALIILIVVSLLIKNENKETFYDIMNRYRSIHIKYKHIYI